MIKRVLMAAAIASSFSPICVAEVIVYDNLGGGVVTDAATSDLSAFIGGETVDDAMLSETTQVTGVNWSGVYAADAILPGGDGLVAASDDDFEIRVYSDVAGAPG